MTRALVAILVVFVIGCGGESNPNTGPSPTPSPTPAPTPAPAPAPVAITLSGVVTAYGARLNGGTVRFLDGPNAGQSTAIVNGDYRFATVTAGNTNLSATVPGYAEQRAGVSLFAVVTQNFSLITAAPFSRSGSGNTVFDMPTYITRVQIQGSFGGSCQNFIMRIGGRTVANEILGTCSVASGKTYSAIAVTTGGTVETVNSNGVDWSVTEVR